MQQTVQEMSLPAVNIGYWKNNTGVYLTPLLIIIIIIIPIYFFSDSWQVIVYVYVHD